MTTRCDNSHHQARGGRPPCLTPPVQTLIRSPYAVLDVTLTSFCPCLFKNVHRVHRRAAVKTMTPPSFLLLVWLLRTAISAFPEEPGPLNFIPTEGDDLLTFTHALPCIPPGHPA
ncbi:hypothetical protein D4764_07G0005530 [Takifugu flavidus]|uniref:Uncharacterized protein n=1 Tax=Takifugu flavidus TaxID=433684 RepID=A0A5C6MRB9_9TELE|nr:hypothetical protein D4764_07G0005530 [Takifugu flavidus]